MPSIWFQRIALFLSLNWIFWQNFFNDFPPDIGDGIMHYFISNAVWSDPIHLLDHWGKPFYILASCVFTLLGMNGVILFNLLTFGLTVWVAWKILDLLKVAELWKVAFPFLLILTPDYAMTMLSALTEPLFSLIFLAATLFFLQKQWGIFAFFMGILPFCRSEGQLAWILAFGLLLLYKQWKAIPLLFVPFLLYGVIGYFALADFLWYFTKSPYSIGNDIYGHGTWSHYFIWYKNYLGYHGLLLILLGILSLVPFIFNKRGTKDEWWFIFMSAGMFFAILGAHILFWAKGINGSIGLTRITTQALPSLLLVCFILIDRFFLLQFLKKPLYPSLLVLLTLSLYSFKRLKTEQDVSLSQMALVKGTKEIYQDRQELSGKFFYHHPLFAINMGFNSNRPDERSNFTYFFPYQEAKNRMKMGDFIAWDGQFGPQEMGVPFDTLMADSNFILLREYSAIGSSAHTGLYLFQKVPASYKIELPPLKEKIKSHQVIDLPSGDQEFLELKIFTENDVDGDFRLTFPSPLSAILVFSDEKHFLYEQHDLKSVQEYRFHHQKESALKVYIWNNERKNLGHQMVILNEIEKTYPATWKP